jgi:hypothetical protein
LLADYEEVDMDKIDLAAEDLFGNDVAEDEDDDVFRAYAVDRDEVRSFSDKARKLCIVRAYKGDGKSALLRLAMSQVRTLCGSDHIMAHGSVSSFAPTIKTDDFTTWVREWKKALFSRIANEVGSKIGFAWTDDEISLVEQAEKGGFKSRSLISTIIERIAFKGKSAGMEVEAVTKKHGVSDAEGVLKRWTEGKEPIWVFVDDVDLNFQNNNHNKQKVASFFVACREVINTVPEVRIRATVRPNVWTIIKMEFEALSHIEQYITDLSWSENTMRRLLAKRVEGYCVRRGLFDEMIENLPTDIIHREQDLIAKVFEGKMQWGNATRPPHTILYTLSKHRPRWIVELAKAAGKNADKNGHSKIVRQDVFDVLDIFGKKRVEDTIAEFRSQCPEIGEILSGFARGIEEYETDTLLKLITNKILNHMSPNIIGCLGKVSALEVAAFLFEIGFLYARRDFSDGSYEHIGFSDKPSLLKSRTNVDDGFKWEIHPVYRQALEIRDSSGYTVSCPRRKYIRT